MTEPTAAAIYVRISEDRDGDALGVARQEKDCRALAVQRGWTVGAVFCDNNISAWGKKSRPEYRRMLASLKAGSVDAVIVYHLDRLTRRPAELEEFFETCDAAGVRHLACVTGDVDLATHDGQFLARILGAVARKESDDKSRRTTRKHQELAEAGRAVGGTRPFGYDVDRVTVRPDEAELIREAARRVLAGETIFGLAREWNRRGIPTSRGAVRWSQTTIRRMLTNERLIGMRTYKGAVVAKGQWPAILDEVTFARLGLVLNAPSRLATVGFGARRYLLTGFLLCGRCGTRLIACAKEGRRRTYVCSSRPDKGGCGGIRVVAEPLEAEVEGRLFAVVDAGALKQAGSRHAGEREEEDLLADVAALEAQLEEGARLWGAGAVSAAEWLAARQGVERRLAAARRRLAVRMSDDQVSRWAGRSQELAEGWTGMELAQRRAVLTGWIEAIDVGPSTLPHGSPRFDGERVRIRWRG